MNQNSQKASKQELNSDLGVLN